MSRGSELVAAVGFDGSAEGALAALGIAAGSGLLWGFVVWVHERREARVDLVELDARMQGRGRGRR